MCVRAMGTTQSEQYGNGMEEHGNLGAVRQLYCMWAYACVWLYTYGRMDGIEDQQESAGARFFLGGAD